MTAAELLYIILSRMKKSFPTALVGFREWIFSANTGAVQGGGGPAQPDGGGHRWPCQADASSWSSMHDCNHKRWGVLAFSAHTPSPQAPWGPQPGAHLSQCMHACIHGAVMAKAA